MNKIQEKTFDAVMEKAYNNWPKDENGREVSYSDFLMSLIPLERNIVVIANWNYQVENGGMQQWVDNRYHRGIDSLSYALGRVSSKHSARVLEMALLAMEEAENLESEDGYDAAAERLNKLDDEYYKFKDEFLTEVYNTFF